MQGLVGAFTGAVAGAMFGVAASTLQYGLAVVAHLPWLAVAQSVLIATAVGVVLSLIGVLYPAIVAARMQPVEAMRAEN
jgi:ABC-type antimicrobial peptide transport system permease subunit